MRTTTHTATTDAVTPGLRRTSVLLWTAQALLAALFLFGGIFKLTIPAEALEQQAQMSGAFLHFISVLEVLGALGLVLPGLTGIRPQLTPLAAAGLVIIMIGATVISAASQGAAAGIMPFVTGVIAALVAYGRSRVPHRSRQANVVSGFSRISRA
jgi:uncharacterized membrane protein YphA (DoxX/SURF4 family)